MCCVCQGTSQTMNTVLSELNCMKFSELLNCMYGIHGSTGQDCFPKMAPVFIHEVNCLYKAPSY